MENAWNEYSRLERDVEWLKVALEGRMSRSDLPQVRFPPVVETFETEVVLFL